MDLWYAWNPSRLHAPYARIIEDLLELVSRGQQEAVNAMVQMMEDLHHNGRGSRYLFSLKGLPIWELKTASRGGAKGGSRVYLFLTPHNQAVLVNCEVKSGTEADEAKLEEVLEVIAATRQGQHVVRREAQRPLEEVKPCQRF